MKKFKIFGFVILLALFILLLFGSCRKTNALGSVFSNYTINISEQDQTHYNLVVIYDLGRSVSSTSDFLIFDVPGYLYLAINNNLSVNQLYIVHNNSVIAETYNLGDTRLIECRVVYDVGNLYLIIYKLSFNIQYSPGLTPAIDGISRTMITRYYLPSTTEGNSVENAWFSQTGVNIQLISDSSTFMPNFLLNASYISSGDTVSQVDTWVDNQFTNYLSYNNILTEGYNYGYDNGYDDGSADGEEVGYDNGYDDGYDSGYYDGFEEGYDLGEQSTDAYQSGYSDGYLAGEETQTAYQDGYAAGASGETAISPVFRIISDVFGAIGAIMAVELVPHIPLGLFILVPLFFAALGLILWIWRRN